MTSGLRGKRVTVMGLGRFGGGVGVTRWLYAQGARPLVTDLRGPDELADSLREIDGIAALRLGRHEEADFRDTDVVVVNPAVPERSPYLAIARDAGVPITTEIDLFVERCPARTVGVTGSVGKSTVTAMIGHILGCCMTAGRVHVGGNLGRSLLDDLPAIGGEDVVVLELSSFQLARTPLVRWSPHVAVLTNVVPNHLDWHGTFAAYLAAKLNIIRFQDPARDHFILHDRPDLRRHVELLYGDLSGVWRYGLDGNAPRAVIQESAAVDCDNRIVRWDGLRLRVPGRHNLENAAAALTVAYVLGIAPADAVQALASYQALPHRLALVCETGGVRYYDDSKSTTPEAAITAMNALEGPLLIILGGYDKGSDLSAVASAAAQRARFAACIGQTGPRLVALVRAAGGEAEAFESLQQAVEACRRRAEPGDSVLLSPACASWGMFRDYRERGQAFAHFARSTASCCAADVPIRTDAAVGTGTTSTPPDLAP